MKLLSRIQESLVHRTSADWQKLKCFLLSSLLMIPELVTHSLAKIIIIMGVVYSHLTTSIQFSFVDEFAKTHEDMTHS